MLRYWEQEFDQLKEVKRRGNRRYYQLPEVLLIRKIRELLHDEGFTIQGAKQRLKDKNFVKEHYPNAIECLGSFGVGDGYDGKKFYSNQTTAPIEEAIE